MNSTVARSFLRSLRTAVAVILVVAGFSACSGDSDGQEADPATSVDTASEGGEATGDVAITIIDFAFGEPLTVEAGTTVAVVNDDGAAHTVTADDDSFDTGVVDAGASTELTLDEAGEFAFFCSIHTSMTGTITVTG